MHTSIVACERPEVAACSKAASTSAFSTASRSFAAKLASVTVPAATDASVCKAVRTTGSPTGTHFDTHGPSDHMLQAWHTSRPGSHQLHCSRADYATNFDFCDNSVREKDLRYRKRGTQAT
jgi:hypothetical protein